MLNTLFGRLLLASVVILTASFGVIAYIISDLIRDNVYAAKSEQLRVQNFVLLTSAQIGDNTVVLPAEQREPLLDEYQSGLYGFVSNVQGDILWQSYSAQSISIPKTLLQAEPGDPGDFEFLTTDDYFIYRYLVRWELQTDKPQWLVFTIMEDNRATNTAIQAFQQRLYRWLAAIAVGLLILLLLTLRWGTTPLRQLAKNLKAIETGKAERIEGNYPIELQSVATNLNQLIDSERLQRERYYTTMADLAHSLKTPLSVIQGELNSQSSSINPLLNDQIQRMDEIIKHQLQRAVIASHHKLAESIPVERCVERIIKALLKVYADKHIEVEQNITENLLFKGDERDLMEILGNLLDNAFKACHNSIKYEAYQTADALIMAIHDDGQGIPEAARSRLIERGQRADTRHSGQGIGLDVATDIIDSYQGKLTIETSPLGGAAFIIRFAQPE